MADDAMKATKLVLMASGQGSQAPGMGADLMDVPEVAAAFELAGDVFGRDIAALCAAEGPDAAAELNDTRNAQAAIATLSLGIGRAVMARGIAPDALLGFSLGQVSALALGGVLTDQAALELVRERSRLMGQAADAHPGAMTALMKGDAAAAEQACAECARGDVLACANYNSPIQTVAAGTPEAIERVEQAWAEKGFRAARLATSGAFHSPLMEDARAPFAAYLEGVAFEEPTIPIICNTDASFVDAATIRQRLADHLTHPVRFAQSIEALTALGADGFAEVGYGGVLAGLVKRCAPKAARWCIQDRQGLDAFVEAQGAR